MLAGKWAFSLYTKNNRVADRDNVTTASASPGDHVTFASDGKLTLRLLGYDDASTYAVRAKDKLQFYGPDVFDIRTLTANRLEIYRKDAASTSQYVEETYVFTR